MKILVIEDQVAVADVLQAALVEDGHEVAVAHSGEDGLRELARDPPDAVFLDVVLPGMDGVAVLSVIRAHDPTLPVIVLTGVAGPEDIERLQRLGVSDVIHKPAILARFTEVLAGLPTRDHGR